MVSKRQWLWSPQRTVELSRVQFVKPDLLINTFVTPLKSQDYLPRADRQKLIVWYLEIELPSFNGVRQMQTADWQTADYNGKPKLTAIYCKANQQAKSTS